MIARDLMCVHTHLRALTVACLGKRLACESINVLVKQLSESFGEPARAEQEHHRGPCEAHPTVCLATRLDHRRHNRIQVLHCCMSDRPRSLDGASNASPPVRVGCTGGYDASAVVCVPR